MEKIVPNALPPTENTLLPTVEVYRRYKIYCEERGYKAAGENRVIPEIAKYLGVEKARKSTCEGQKMCLVGARFVDEPIIAAKVPELPSS